MPPLDGIRGLAILLVLLLHFRAPDLTHPLKGILGLGWTGVQLFFVLSGFLITGILLDTRSCSNYFSSFWMRRTLRIFPLYFLALSVFLVAAPAVLPVPKEALPPAADQVYYWTYLNNWIPMGEEGRLVHVLGHFWSLAVEEQFYLVWPVVVWLVPPRMLLRGCAVACLLILAARSWAFFTAGDLGMVYRNTVLRA
ncbi:MAG: acyltransferase, partial [Acidobacteria bacterium]|nr:acyltransferase [Acidobacteriota bacterium]